jgi:ribokinase
MTVYCFGSINIDNFYQLPHLPSPGETVSANDYALGLGGKGANQAVAAAQAGADVRFIGAVGADGAAILDRLTVFGVNTDGVDTVAAATGHALILVGGDAENMVIVHAGANAAQNVDKAAALLAGAELGDILLMQNETSGQVEVAKLAIGLGMEVFYSAAPFDVAAVRAILPYVTVLLVNELEAAQLTQELGLALDGLPVETVVVTRGGEGAEWIARGSHPLKVDAHKVDAVDMEYAAAAAGLQVTRRGTADAMPARAEVEALLRTA